jgi:hemoglobin
VSGGPEPYTGKNMYDAHTGMNINHEEFLEVLSDIKLALEKNHVSEADQDRLMALNFGLKNEVLEH